jgi:hypothetical protein
VAGSVLGARVAVGADGRDGGCPLVVTGAVMALVGGVGGVVGPTGVEVVTGPEPGMGARPVVGPATRAGVASLVVGVPPPAVAILSGLGLLSALRSATGTTTATTTAAATMNHSRR